MIKDAKNEGRYTSKVEEKNEETGYINQFIRLLAHQNCTNDIVHSASDNAYQQALFEKFGL